MVHEKEKSSEVMTASCIGTYFHQWSLMPQEMFLKI